MKVLICPVIIQTYCLLEYNTCTNLTITERDCCNVIPLYVFFGLYNVKISAKPLCEFSHSKDLRFSLFGIKNTVNKNILIYSQLILPYQLVYAQLETSAKEQSCLVKPVMSELKPHGIL